MVERAKISDAEVIAGLHQKTIFDGFLSKLGTDFLSSLYVFLINKELVNVYRDGEKVVGFISLSRSTKGILRMFIIFSPGSLFKLLFLALKKPSLLKPIFETVKITFGTLLNEPRREFKRKVLPNAELLSMAVEPDNQQVGVGADLVSSLDTYLDEFEINEYKVIVGENLTQANKFYLKNGFVFSTQIKVHGEDLSNVYVKSLRSSV